MNQRDIILVPETVLPKAIMTDDLPRNGGLWPEYAHTLFLCVDRYENGLAEGRLHGFCVPEPRLFLSLDQMLFQLDDYMEQTQLVQAAARPRSLKKPNNDKSVMVRDYKRWLTEKGPERRPPAYGFRDLRPQRGQLATYYVRVYSRLHASMQGFLAQTERLHLEPVAFRSAWELLQMLRSSLTDAAGRG